MRSKTWLVAGLGLGCLVMLIAVSMLAAVDKAQDIYAQLDQLNAHHRRVEDTLRRLRADVNLSGIFVRDYLLDVARERAPEYREQIAEFRRTNLEALRDLRPLINDDSALDRLDATLTDYWSTFEPLFDWTTAEKIVRSAGFLRREVVPRREAVLTIFQQIEALNNTNLARQRDEVSRRHDAFNADLYRLLWQTLLLGVVVSLIVVLRLRVLEGRSETARRHMQELSQRLVNTQEEERRHLARELHDHVAQVLTGLRMELGRIERLSTNVGPVVLECKKLVDEMFNTVRSLSQGLRPSMLDDFGLQAALEWHARDFMTRYAVNVDLTIDPDFDALPDNYRTCIYRVVQEAMTNCVRHADASSIRVAVIREGDRLKVSVSDDGVGVDLARPRHGLGLRGIEERARELGGAMTIGRGGSGGTVLVVRLPLPASELEVAHARAAG